MTDTQQTDFTVNTPLEAHVLRQLHSAAETARNEARAASKAMTQQADQIASGHGHIIDFSTSHVERYREALAKRDTLLEVARGLKDVRASALVAAAEGRPFAWFSAAKSV